VRGTEDLRKVVAAARMAIHQTPQPERLGQVLSAVMARLARRPGSMAKIEKAWTSALPRHLESGCRLLGLEDGVLWIKVRDPSYKYELGLQSELLLKAIRAQPGCGRVKGIRLVLQDE